MAVLRLGKHRSRVLRSCHIRITDWEGALGRVTCRQENGMQT